MILVWLFWLLLLAPGAALYLRIRPAEERASGFETIAAGYLLSFLVLVPLCVLGFALVLPVWTFGAGVVLAIGAGLAALYRMQRAGELRFAFDPAHVPALLVIAFLMIHANALGGHVVNDADFHLARIRLLYDHGLTNADPITQTGFSHPYHTNIVHALIAAGSKLTFLDPIVFWQATLPWAKLLTASAVATLCARLGGSTLALWTVALYQLGFALRLDWVLYPNQLGPLWLVPLGLTGCIGLFATERTRYPALLIGGSALLLGFVHGLYAGFLAVLGALVVLVLAAHRVIVRRGQVGGALRLGLLAGVLLALPAPALYVAKATHAPAQANFDYQGGAPTPRKSKAGRWTRALKPDAEGRFHLASRRALGGGMEQLLAAAALLALVARKRIIEALGIAASLAGCLVVLTVPVVAGFAVKKLGSAWMLERLLDVVTVQFLALVGAGLVPALDLARRSVRYAVSLIPVIACVIAAILGSGGFTEDSFTKIDRSFDEFRRLQIFTGRLPKQYQEEQALLRKIPAGSVVFTHPLAARQIRKLHDLRFVRASRNHTGVDDLRDRTKDIAKLMNAKAPNPELIEVLERRGIVYAIQKKDHPVKWLNGQKVIAETEWLKLIKLDVKRLKKALKVR